MTIQTQQTTDRTLSDGRHLHVEALIWHTYVKGDRTTTISNITLRFDGGPHLTAPNCHMGITNRDFVKADKHLLDLWVDHHPKEISEAS